jgi:hypothetical protein
MAFHEQGASGVLPHPQDRGHARSWNGTAQKVRCRRESPPTKCLISPCVDGSGLASAFFTRAVVVGAAMCSAC